MMTTLWVSVYGKQQPFYGSPTRGCNLWLLIFSKKPFGLFIIVTFSLICSVLSFRTNFESPHKGIGLNITRILNAFFERGYDKRVRPNYGGPPVEVGVTMYIISISSVSEVQMARPMIKDLYVGAEVADRIWVPDTFFANEKSAYFHTATTPNTFLRIGHEGDIFRSMRLTVTASCPMDLQYFPMDRQLCTIEVESYGYSMADIRYKWDKGEASVGLQSDLELPQFRVVGHRQKQKEINLSTGNYSRLICEIQFARSMGYYLIQIYIPASLIVIISWVSFWLHRNATPARVALGVTTDVFLGTCFVMVFASLLEYATVGYLGKRIAMRKSRIDQLTKLADEHRKKCAAAAAAASAAAEAAAQEYRLSPPQPHIICATPRLPLNPALHVPCGVKTPVHHQQGGRCMGGPSPKLGQGGGGGGVPGGRGECPQGSGLFKRMDPKPGGGGKMGNELGDGLQPPLPPPPHYGLKDHNRMLGIRPSDIDKYSRVVFPVCFICFNLMYWIIYMHISNVLMEDIVHLKKSS